MTRASLVSTVASTGCCANESSSKGAVMPVDADERRMCGNARLAVGEESVMDRL